MDLSQQQPSMVFLRKAVIPLQVKIFLLIVIGIRPSQLPFLKQMPEKWGSKPKSRDRLIIQHVSMLSWIVNFEPFCWNEGSEVKGDLTNLFHSVCPLSWWNETEETSCWELSIKKFHVWEVLPNNVYYIVQGLKLIFWLSGKCTKT